MSVEKNIIRELEKEFSINFKSTIFFKLFKKEIVKIYKIGVTYGFNSK